MSTVPPSSLFSRKNKPKKHSGQVKLPKVEERRKWDKEALERKAKERVEREKQEMLNLDLDQLGSSELISSKSLKPEIVKLKPGQTRASLKRTRDDAAIHREIESRVGRVQKVSSDVKRGRRGGWFCETCQCNFKDSLSYLDHINGKNHHKRLGMSMRIEQSSLADVMAAVQKKSAQKTDEFAHFADGSSLIQKKKTKNEVRSRKRGLSELINAHNDGDDQEQQSGDLGETSKFNAIRSLNEERDAIDSSQIEERISERKDEMDRMVESKLLSKKRRKKNKKNDNDEGNKDKHEIDPEMAAMGFTFSFGGSKKT